MARTAYLRVYQPLSEFPPDEQGRWANYENDDAAADVRAARRWLIGGFLPDGDAATWVSNDGAFVRTIEESVFVCPWRTRLRMLAGLLAFRGSVPAEIADAFVPEERARHAAEELVALERRYPEVRSHILHSNWHVPLRWFAAFDESERILTEDKGGLRVRYETRLGLAKARLRRTHDILEGSWVDDEVHEAVQELVEWLADFSDGSLLELDYGSVASIFSDDDLADDCSAAEVARCIDALEEGDVVGAGRIFVRLTDRWTDVRAHEVVN